MPAVGPMQTWAGPVYLREGGAVKHGGMSRNLSTQDGFGRSDCVTAERKGPKANCSVLSCDSEGLFDL